ncbi:thiopeptide-type bacteriocin biosynthesis protein [Flammeovirga aprica]|uniref:Thiopeptide-type bacteriocin biosynthesis domain-containing protein n=1 Tax=Flammeovirga aprica JL-4 TaxID=694437 RepID=A0A7X9P1R5_9BACT|nr:thiopeptide-type bacteriocin biosynthesis protein [Flammeovirga aprica]NME66792.1 hypothetical protein [Flammeovirga aprica JL-4]
MKRFFMLGDGWLYFKIYGGVKHLEGLLYNQIHTYSQNLLHSRVIDKFFFIRYADPDYHLRVRFHISPQSNYSIDTLLQEFNKILEYSIHERLVYRYSLDCYSRELERYGEDKIQLAEEFFQINSVHILEYLKYEYSHELGDHDRWIWGLNYAIGILGLFDLNIDEKILFTKELKDSFSLEFPVDKPNKIKINNKYREYIDRLGSNVIIQEHYDLLGLSSFKPKHEFLFGLLHMHFNRLFRTEARKYESLIYNFMNKYFVTLKKKKH